MKKFDVFYVVAIVIVIVIVTLGSFIYFNNQPSEENIIILETPEKCKIGQLVTFDASMNQMDDITWNISPPTFNFRIIDNGRRAIFSSEKAENYIITVAIANDNKVYLVINKLKVIPTPPHPILPDLNPIKPKNILPIETIINILPLPNKEKEKEKEKEEKEEYDPNLNITPWLPSNLNRMDKIIENLNILCNLIDKDRFETEDEIIQAVIWGIKRWTQEDKTWEPFILNLSKYLENSTSKQNCAKRIKNILIHLKKIENAKT